jgi:hypothetical protein
LVIKEKEVVIHSYIHTNLAVCGLRWDRLVTPASL